MNTIQSSLRSPGLRAPQRRAPSAPEAPRRTSPLIVAAVVGLVAAGGFTIVLVYGASQPHHSASIVAPDDGERERERAEAASRPAPRPSYAAPAPAASEPPAAPAGPPSRPTFKPDAEIARDYVAKLRASGPTSAPWTTRAVDALETLTRSFKGDLRDKVHATGVECFKAGCFVEVHSPNRDVLRDASDELFADASSAFNQWPGLRQMAPPVIGADGTVSSTWALLPEQE